LHLISIKNLLLRLPRAIKRLGVIFLDAFISSFTLILTFGFCLNQWGWLHGNQFWILIFTLILSTTLFLTFGLYQEIFRHVGSYAFLSIVKVFLVYAFVYVSAIIIIGMPEVPWTIGVLQPLLFFMGVGINRYLIRIWLGDSLGHKAIFRKIKRKALIYGAGSAGRQLASGLMGVKELEVLGFIDDDPKVINKTINGLLVHPAGEIDMLIKNGAVTDILLAIPSASQNRRNKIIDALQGRGVRVRTLPGLSDIAFGRVTGSDLRDLDMNDLLGREVVPPNIALLEKNIKDKVVLVTGAGGSIGSELCRQILKFSPRSLILIDSSEFALYKIYQELVAIIDVGQSIAMGKDGGLVISPCLCSVRDFLSISKLFSLYKPNIVFHAAAYKHVPLVEKNYEEGIRNNVWGTLYCAKLSMQNEVEYFVLVSTDKAVRPTNVMGASKRIAELVLQAMAEICIKNHIKTKFLMVRFGNVLGSSGSVAPLFTAQINSGGPITLTHPEVTRYFMTIPEAAQLVIQASSMALGGDVFVLKMGEPVRIFDLAKRIIYLSGMLVRDRENPNGDIEIKITGLRPGEKLYEELLIGNNPESTDHPRIMKAREEYLSWDILESEINFLDKSLQLNHFDKVVESLERLVEGYKSK
jgi:FlaA1/EpsC-like NDP-sugar epimerase